MITSEQKVLAISCHLSFLLAFTVGFVVPFLSSLVCILVPLAIFLIKKDDPFVVQHAKQALVLQGLMLIVSAVSFVLTLITIGILGIILVPALIILGVLVLIFALIASYKALQGEPYEYPLIQGIVKLL